MNLLQRILLRLSVHKQPPQLSRTQDSVSTPLGHLPYRDGNATKRHVNTQVPLDEGVQRARSRRYVRGRGDEC